MTFFDEEKKNYCYAYENNITKQLILLFNHEAIHAGKIITISCLRSNSTVSKMYFNCILTHLKGANEIILWFMFLIRLANF